MLSSPPVAHRSLWPPSHARKRAPGRTDVVQRITCSRVAGSGSLAVANANSTGRTSVCRRVKSPDRNPCIELVSATTATSTQMRSGWIAPLALKLHRSDRLSLQMLCFNRQIHEQWIEPVQQTKGASSAAAQMDMPCLEAEQIRASSSRMKRHRCHRLGQKPEKAIPVGLNDLLHHSTHQSSPDNGLTRHHIHGLSDLHIHARPRIPRTHEDMTPHAHYQYFMEEQIDDKPNGMPPELTIRLRYLRRCVSESESTGRKELAYGSEACQRSTWGQRWSGPKCCRRRRRRNPACWDAQPSAHGGGRHRLAKRGAMLAWLHSSRLKNATYLNEKSISKE